MWEVHFSLLLLLHEIAEQWRRMIVIGGFQQAKLLETEMPFLITLGYISVGTRSWWTQTVFCRATSAELKCCRELGVTGDRITREMVGGLANRWVWGRISCSGVWSISRGWLNDNYRMNFSCCHRAAGVLSTWSFHFGFVFFWFWGFFGGLFKKRR